MGFITLSTFAINYILYSRFVGNGMFYIKSFHLDSIANKVLPSGGAYIIAVLILNN